MLKERTAIGVDDLVVSVLSEIRAEYNLFDPKDEPKYRALSTAIEAINAQRWIPVTEQLPEKDGLYIVSVINDHNRRYSKTCWYHGHEKWFARQDVVAWMPLPEAYEPTKEEA